MSRREAARLLGFASEFPIRQLEKDGQLRAVRGAMGQAWYPRDSVLGLLPAGLSARRGRAAAAEGASRPTHSPAPGAWSDAALIGLLRELVPAADGAREAQRATARPRTVVDLVADTGVSIARATRIHRFWLAHDRHPTAELARTRATPSTRAGGATEAVTDVTATAFVAQRGGPSTRSAPPAMPRPGVERRRPDRVERDGLIRKLRDPDPAVRASAFEKLRPGRKQ